MGRVRCAKSQESDELQGPKQPSSSHRATEKSHCATKVVDRTCSAASKLSNPSNAAQQGSDDSQNCCSQTDQPQEASAEQKGPHEYHDQPLQIGQHVGR